MIKNKIRLFLNAGHSIGVDGAEGHGFSENSMNIDLRDRIIEESLAHNDIDVISVPDTLNLRESIDWVNKQASSDDIAVSVHFNSNNNKFISGTEVYYSNEREEELAVIFAKKVSEFGGLTNRGARSDALTWVGSLGWLRMLKCDSVLVEVCYLTNATDMAIYNPSQTAIGFIKAIRSIIPIVDELPNIEEMRLKVTLYQKIVKLLIDVLTLKLKLRSIL